MPTFLLISSNIQKNNKNKGERNFLVVMVQATSMSFISRMLSKALKKHIDLNRAKYHPRSVTQNR